MKEAFYWTLQMILVEASGLEPPTSGLQSRRSPKLSYAPTAKERLSKTGFPVKAFEFRL